jgi:hypothetical protein
VLNYIHRHTPPASIAPGTVDEVYHPVLYLRRLRIFKVREFAAWCRKVEWTDEALRNTVREICSGLVDANLGGSLYKKRIALEGRGKRGSARAVAVYEPGKRIFFVYGFEKSERENITRTELQALRQYASKLLSMSDKDIEAALKAGNLIEVR